MDKEHQKFIILIIPLVLLVPFFLVAYTLPEQEPSVTPTPTISLTPSSILTETPTFFPTISISPSPTGKLTESSTSTESMTPTITGTLPTLTPSLTPTLTLTPSMTPTITLTPVPRLETSISHSLVHKWSLVYWNNNQIACNIYSISQNSPPTHKEILNQCDNTIYWLWYNSEACDQNNYSGCKGFYLYDAGMTTADISNEYIRPLLVNVEVRCDRVNIDGAAYCMSQPMLVFNGADTKGGAWIKSITINGLSDQNKVCEGSHCEVFIPDSGSGTLFVKYWATSSLGDSTAPLMLAVQATQNNSRPKFWKFNLIGNNLEGPSLSGQVALAADWLSIPPLDPPEFLAFPHNYNEITTQKEYYYLAGMLIREGYVLPKNCSSMGMEANGITANECGLFISKPRLTDWQNIFDQTIFSIGINYRLPPRLLKSIFSRESQFFPGYSHTEFGLGHITDDGADTLLMYDSDLFDSYCSRGLGDTACIKGYTGLDNGDQSILRGMVLQDADAYCSNCQNHINISKANGSIEIFARLLIAFGRQIGRVIEMDLNRKPGQVASYDDLWKFTLLAYNAGAGCFEQALLTHPYDQPLTWESIKPYISIGCQNGIYYAESIAVP